ncbi:MAG: glycosyltransferase family 39 protein, partial [Acidobacteria bacterium]|nr:glycosyltransferase family 39 protein [Acidobacteriota bacterium]
MPDRMRTQAAALWGAAAVALAIAVALIYASAIDSYFFNDDFQWLQSAYRFEAARFIHLDRYDHFYRPVIETYFYLGYRLFGCDARAFHLVSVGIHVLVTLLVYMLGRSLTGNRAFAGLAALFFAVLPGFVDAVSWIGAITDQLPAIWYVLAIWLHLLFLQRGSRWLYAAALASFATCLLTHESSATLVVMMIAVEATHLVEAGNPLAWKDLARRALRYGPHALLLAGYLAIEYIVNTRSYLVKEGHYQLGWHAIPHALEYIVWLYVGKRTLVSFAAILAVGAALVIRGTPRVRLYVAWIIVNIAPVAFFTWSSTGRYLYLPAIGFVFLMAEGVLAGHALLARRVSSRTALTVVGVVVLALSVRFAVFAA